MFLSVEGWFLADHFTNVPLAVVLVLALQKVAVFVLYCELCGLVITGCEKSLYCAERTILPVLDERQLFFIVFHHFGLCMVLPCIVHYKLCSKKVAFHFSHVADMVLRYVNIACGKDVLGKTLFLAGKNEFFVFLKVYLVCVVYQSTVRLLDEQVNTVTRVELGV